MKRETAASVVIPTHRRAHLLRECVRSLLKGTVVPSEIVVVCRHGDRETEQVLLELQLPPVSHIRIRDMWVDVLGHIPPVAAGTRSATNQLVAIVDDDVTVAPTWLDHMIQHFSDPKVGVVGGHVVVPTQPRPKLRGRPGRLSWYGKHWGNIGSVEGHAPFEVCAVMEGNWVWRQALLASLEFDPVLNFDDASMYGMDLCLQAKGRGFKVLYEPRAVVFHHLAPRSPELDRADRPRRVFTYCRNYTYVILKHFSWWQMLGFLIWWFMIGERGGWGLGAMAVDTLVSRLRWRREVGPAMRGKVEGVRLWLRR